MKVDLKREENNIVKLDIEIPAQDAVTEYNKAVKKISQYANIPGFRKGKAPRNIVEKHVGVDTIKQEALDAILPNAFRTAIIENHLDVIAQPLVESFSFEVGEDVKITASVELRPEVTLGDYKGMTVDVEEYVTEKDAFDKSLQNFLERNATYSIVTNRPAKDTDICVIDFDGSVDGEKIQGGKAEKYPLDLGNSNFIPGFAEQVVGHNLDEEFDINVTFPESYHEKKLAGKPAVFKIKIHEIKEKVLPELTDEFAQKVGHFESAEALKADIQKFLDDTKKANDDRNISNAIFEKVIENAKVDIQDSMIKREADMLLNEYKQRLQMQGFSYEDAVKAQGEENMQNELRADALKRIKNSLVIDKIAQVENIKIEKEDLEGKFKEVENAYHMDRTTLLKQFQQNPEIFTSMSQQALNEKVAKFLVDNNTANLVSKK